MKPLAAVVLPLVLFTPIAAQAQEEAVCIAVVMPKVQLARGNVGNAAESLRDMFVSYLTGPTIKGIALQSKLASQAIEEARRTPCERVLITSLVQKGGGGRSPFGRAMGDAAGSALGHVPYGSSAGTAAARAAAVSGARAVTTVATSTRKKDELKLEYRIETVDGKSVLPARTEQAKAKNDGEDILTPLVEKAAEAVATALTSVR